MRPPTSLPYISCCMTIVDHHQGFILIRQITYFVQLSDRAIHRKNTICHDQFSSGSSRRFQLLLQILHIVVLVSESLRLAKTNPIDRSEEHTSELQSRGHLVCRLLLEKKNQRTHHILNMYSNTN